MAILGLSILINRSYFQLNVLKPGICRFQGFASPSALSVFMCDANEAIVAILILAFIFDYWHNVLEAVVSDLWTFICSRGIRGHASPENFEI